MDAYREVLNVIATERDPIGWYGIEIRLGIKGVLLEDNLIKVLRALETKGFLIHHEVVNHPHGVYQITDAGIRYLGSTNEEETSSTA